MAAITRQQIDHVTPKRDFVGPAPTRLEWTTIDGVETYTITVSTEIDSVVFQQVGARGNAIEWPKEIALEPGTYFWRVVGIKGGRTIADSGRSAFVVSGQALEFDDGHLAGDRPFQVHSRAFTHP